MQQLMILSINIGCTNTDTWHCGAGCNKELAFADTSLDATHAASSKLQVWVSAVTAIAVSRLENCKLGRALEVTD